MRKSLIGALLAALLVFAPTPVLSIEPITDALLDRAESRAKSVIERAEAAGNSVARAIGEQALMAIKALREAVHSSIGDAKQAALDVQQQTFNNVNLILERAENAEKVVLTDVTGLTAALADQIKNLPFTNHAPEIMLYQPRVLVAKGPDLIAVRVIGPKLAASNPRASFGGVPVVLERSRDTELIARLERSKFKFDDKSPKVEKMKITLDRAEPAWWKPWTFFFSDLVERDVALMLLPSRLGSYTITTKLKSTKEERKTISKGAGGRGKDRPYDTTIAPDPTDRDDGWEIDVVEIKKSGLSFRFVGGHDGSCVGYLPESLTKKSFTFRIQHGHKTDWKGEKSDADVHCSMTVPLLKVTPTIIPGPTIAGEINWIEDVSKDLPENFASYEINLELFDSKKFTVRPDSKVPFGVVEIERGKDYIQFRPKPPLDF